MHARKLGMWLDDWEDKEGFRAEVGDGGWWAGWRWRLSGVQHEQASRLMSECICKLSGAKLADFQCQCNVDIKAYRQHTHSWDGHLHQSAGGSPTAQPTADLLAPS